MILLDTSGLVAAMFTDQDDHSVCKASLEQATPPLLLSPFVLAELDYLVMRHAGVEAELLLLQEVAEGAYDLVDFGPNDVVAAHSVAKRFHDLDLGLADASIAVLSSRYETLNVLTLDERHFRTVTGWQDRQFTLLPADG